MNEKLMKLLASEDWKERFQGEYAFVKDKYNKLHRMIILREAGALPFTPNCSIGLWKAQASAMGAYLGQLEVRSVIEGVELIQPEGIEK